MDVTKECSYSNLKAAMVMLGRLQNRVGNWTDDDLKKIEHLEQVSKRLISEQKKRH